MGKHAKLSFFIAITQPLAILPIMFIIVHFSQENVWWSFLLGELFVVLICIIYSIYHKIKDKKLNAITLLPLEKSSKILDISISNVSNSDFSQFINQVGEFLVRNNVNDKIKYHIDLCCEELLSNILRYAYKNSNESYIDVNINICPDNILLSIKDNGISFNPLEHNDSKNIGLLIVKGICKDITYQRINGQNMVFVKF